MNLQDASNLQIDDEIYIVEEELRLPACLSAHNPVVISTDDKYPYDLTLAPPVSITKSKVIYVDYNKETGECGIGYLGLCNFYWSEEEEIPYTFEEELSYEYIFTDENEAKEFARKMTEAKMLNNCKIFDLTSEVLRDILRESGKGTPVKKKRRLMYEDKE